MTKLRRISASITIVLLYVLLISFPIFSYTSCPSLYSIGTLANNFSVSNTTSSVRLLEQSAELPYLGKTWNVSIHILPNSTSGVSVEFNAHNKHFGNPAQFTWEGPEIFEIAPNETYNTKYVQHMVSDDMGSWWLDYRLLDPTKQANGVYSIHVTNVGYYVDIGLGNLYKSDITDWLLSQNQDGSFPLVELMIGLLVGGGIIIVWKKPT